MTTSSVINLGPGNQQEIEAFASRLIEEVNEGITNPLELRVKLHAFRKAIEKVEEAIAAMSLGEADKYHEKKFSAYGAEIEKVEAGVRLDFTGCNDPEWNEAFVKENEWKGVRQEREAFLKTLKKPFEQHVGEGEIVTINPPVRKSTSTIKITHK